MPGDDRRVPVRRSAWALLLPALLLAGFPARAAQARAELKVEATVAVACLVSTAAQGSAPSLAAGLATMSCTDGRGGAVSVEQRPSHARRPAAALSASATGPAGDPPSALTVITIAY